MGQMPTEVDAVSDEPKRPRLVQINLEVCHLRCVCENWKGYVVKHNYVN